MHPRTVSVWVSASDAAHLHKVSERYLRTLAARLRWRKLRHRRQVHYHHDDLDAWREARDAT